MSANDRQIGGEHYKTESGFPEHWDIVWHYKLDYFQGQITKYVMRWKEKGGLDDLRKAQHVLEKYIELNSGSEVSAPVVRKNSRPRSRHLVAKDKNLRRVNAA